jgi:hypothetical protein
MPASSHVSLVGGETSSYGAGLRMGAARRPGVGALEGRSHEDVLAKRRQRLERRRQLVGRAFDGRKCPF